MDSSRSPTSRSARGDGPARLAIRLILLAALAAAPLAFGGVQPGFYQPFLAVLFLTGAASWARARWARANGEPVPTVPGVKLLLALHALVLIQLVPLPEPFLARISPGSVAMLGFREYGSWHPVSVDPKATWWGLAFLAGMSLLFATSFREFRNERWARRLALLVVGVAVVATLVGFVQRASPDPGLIYGHWKAADGHVVFGPYVNRNHYAGYLVMAIPLLAAIVGGSARRFVGLARRIGVRAVGQPEATAVLQGCAALVLLVGGVLFAASRAGIVASTLALGLVALGLGRRMIPALVLVGSIGLLGALTVDLSWFAGIFSGRRDLTYTRVALWRDQVRLVPDFPMLGTGFNALGRPYRRIQTYERVNAFDQAHNDYLQLYLETGPVGALIGIGLLVLLARCALRGARHSELGRGLLAALLASAITALVDFNWQIPGNAATFVALAGVALGRVADTDGPADLDPLAGHT
ncbi:MAG: O-antigen ligase family protein [Vicinamibacteria bacterium]